MADGVVGASLFDEEGPKKFAEEVSKISGALTGVQSSFGNFGAAAEKSLSNLSGVIDALVSKLQSMQTSLQNGVSAVSGMAQPAAAAPSGQTGSPTPNWTMSNAPQPDGKTGQGTPSMPPSSPPNAPTSFPQQQQGSASMGQRAMQSMVPAAIGTAANYVGGLTASAVQGQLIGAMYGPTFGVSQRSLYTMPQGFFAQRPQDYQQAAYISMMGGVAPGTSNWSTVMGSGGAVNQLSTLVPGSTPQQNAQTFTQSMMSPQTLHSQLAFGFNFSPGGKMMSPQQQYQSVFQRLAQGVGGRPTGAQLAAWLRPGGPWSSNLAAMGWQPGSPEYQGFVNYAAETVGYHNQGKQGPLPNMGTAAGVAKSGIGNSAWWQQLRKESAQSQVESQAEPALAQAARDLNQAAANLLHATSPLGTLLGGGAFGGGGGGMMGAAAGIGMNAAGLYFGSKAIGKILPRGARMAGKVLGRGSRLLNGLRSSIKGGGRAAPEATGEAAATDVAAGVGEDAAATGALATAEGVGAAADTTVVGAPVGLAIGAGAMAAYGGYQAWRHRAAIGHAAEDIWRGGTHLAGRAAGGISHGLSSVAHGIGGIAHSFFGGLFGGGSAGAAQPRGATGDVSSLLSAKPPRDSLLACLTTPIKRTDNTLAAALVYNTTGPGGAGGTGGAGTGPAGAGGGGSGGKVGTLPWNYRSSTTGPIDLSGSYSVGKGFESQFTSSTGSSGSGSTGTGGGNSVTPATGNVPAGGDYDQTSWAKAFLTAINAPTSAANVTSVVKWENREGGNWSNKAKYNPLNTSQTMPGSVNFNTGQAGSGVQAYTSWQQGLQATVDTITNGRFNDILSALQGGKGLTGNFSGLGVWSDAAHGGYTSLARGSQLVARTGLALLHAGEAVVPAADNYSTSPYNRGGAGGGGGSTYLHFKAGSVVLQVPPNSTQQDMDDIANKFVAAISKPAIIAGVRSQ